MPLTIPATHVPCFASFDGPVSTSLGTGARTSRKRLVVLKDCSDLRVVYPGYYRSSSTPQEGPVGNDYTVKCAIEHDNTYVPVVFGTEATGTVPDGGFLTSDALNVSLIAGQVIYVRTFVTGGPNYPLATGQVGYNLGGYDSYTATTDLCYQSTYLATDTNGACCEPCGIFALPTVPKRSFAIIGDSTVISADGAYGRGDTWSGNVPNREDFAAGGNMYALDGGGWPSRALRMLGIPYIGLSFGGEKSSDFTAVGSPLRLALASLCTDWLVVYGTNDLAAGPAAQVIASLEALIALGNARGIRVWVATIPPRTTSTDAWVTVTNQTVTATNADRVTVNTWIRTLPRCIEVADAMETSRNSGIFRLGDVHDSGTVISVAGAAYTIHSGSSRVPPNRYAYSYALRITGGTGAGQIGWIASNALQTVTMASAFATPPDNTSTYEIFGVPAPSSVADGSSTLVHPGRHMHFFAAKNIIQNQGLQLLTAGSSYDDQIGNPRRQFIRASNGTITYP